MEVNNKNQTREVSLQKCADYGQDRVREALHHLLSPLGGLSPLVQGKAVLLKPNFLVPRPAAKAVCTHPEVIRSVAELAIQAGAREVVVADSPGFGKARWVAKRLGLLTLLEPLGVPVIELDQETEVHRPGNRFPRLVLARRVVEAEVVINLAKLKSHGLCGMTMAVKNCFGAVPGLGKAQWHLRAQKADHFAAMLVDVCRAVNPALSIVDAIDSMDGNGPGSGRVRRTGFLAASRDPFVLDRVLARILGLPDGAVSTFGPDGSPALDGLSILGVRLEEIAVRDWQLPGPKRSLRSLLGRLGYRLVPTPKFDRRTCDLCQLCLQICPAKALRVHKDRLRLDESACIHCFCCQEICPKGAISVRKGWLD